MSLLAFSYTPHTLCYNKGILSLRNYNMLNKRTHFLSLISVDSVVGKRMMLSFDAGEKSIWPIYNISITNREENLNILKGWKQGENIMT